jgi:hypothetical protein
MSKLTSQLDDALDQKDTQVVMENPADFSAIIQKINDSLANMDFNQKSNIIGDNLTGVLQAMELNNFIEIRLGKEFRIESLDTLIHNKLRYVMSVDNKGTANLLKALGMLQPNIISQMPVTLQERLLGDNPKDKSGR